MSTNPKNSSKKPSSTTPNAASENPSKDPQAASPLKIVMIDLDSMANPPETATDYLAAIERTIANVAEAKDALCEKFEPLINTGDGQLSPSNIPFQPVTPINKRLFAILKSIDQLGADLTSLYRNTQL